MGRRFTITTLGAIVLFSQVSTFIIAALCPHIEPELPHCVSQQPVTHHDAGHVQTSSEATNPTRQSLSQPKDFCTHCAAHTRTTSQVATLTSSEAKKRAHDSAVQLPVTQPSPLAYHFSGVVPQRAHGPPGTQTPRYILLNIFRI